MPSIEKMTPLQTQEQFEELVKSNLTMPCLFYFTAKWCGPCQRLDWDDILTDIKECDVYKCDVDENTYTPGYCGVRSMPSFLILHTNNKFSSVFQSSDTKKVKEWLANTL